MAKDVHVCNLAKTAVGCMGSLEDDRNWSRSTLLQVDSYHMLVAALVQPPENHTVITRQQLPDGNKLPQSWLDHQIDHGLCEASGAQPPTANLRLTSGMHRENLAQQTRGSKNFPDLHMQLLKTAIPAGCCDT